MSPEASEKISSAYNNERKRLLGYIRNRIPGGIEAEDILQDVFYQLTWVSGILTGLKTLQPGCTK